LGSSVVCKFNLWLDRDCRTSDLPSDSLFALFTQMKHLLVTCKLINEGIEEKLYTKVMVHITANIFHIQLMITQG
jgi:hypothetical protein